MKKPRLLSKILGISLALLVSAQARAAMDLSANAVLRDHLWKDLSSKPKDQRPATGLVLSAGGTRASAHIGVISVLEESGFPIDAVAGTSMGAIIGSLYADGKSPEELRRLSLRIGASNGSNISPWTLIEYLFAQKLFSSKKLERFIKKEIGDKRFEQLKKPFACVAMDINSGEAIIFREGRVAPAVRASMNLPGIFKPVEYRHRYLVDGAIVDYVPVDAARLLGAKWVLASVTEDDFTQARPDNVISSMQQVIDIRGAMILDSQKKTANFLIEPAVGTVPSAGGTSLYMTPRPWMIDQGALQAHRLLHKAEESYILFSMPAILKGYL